MEGRVSASLLASGRSRLRDCPQTTCCFQRSVSLWARMRATTSLLPAAANGIRKRTGRPGKLSSLPRGVVCATAAVQASQSGIAYGQQLFRLRGVGKLAPKSPQKCSLAPR